MMLQRSTSIYSIWLGMTDKDRNLDASVFEHIVCQCMCIIGFMNIHGLKTVSNKARCKLSNKTERQW